MESRQEKYFKNYVCEQILDDSKKGFKNVYRYIGDLYTWNTEENKLQKIRRTVLAGEIATIVLFAAASILRSNANTSAFVAIPGIISLALWLFEVFAAVPFCFYKLPLREDDYSRVNNTFFITFVCRAIVLFIASAAAIIVSVTTGPGMSGFLSAVLYLACGVLAVFMKLTYSSLKDDLKVIQGTAHQH